MKSFEYTEIGIDVLYDYVRGEFSISYDIFVYTLDWLFVVGAICLSNNGNIMYASD